MTTRRALDPGSEVGVSLLEILIGLALSLTVAGGIFTLAAPASTLSASLPELADVSQRARYAFERLRRDLRDVGYGLRGHPTFPPEASAAVLLPYRLGRNAPVGAHRAPTSSTLTLLRAAGSASPGRTAGPVAGATPVVDLEPDGTCGRRRCGAGAGDLVMLSNDEGLWELFRVQDRSGLRLSLDRLHATTSSFASGAKVTVVQLDHYYHDETRDQLRHYDGWRADFPLIEGVVAFEVQWRVAPPLSPTPCLPAGDEGAPLHEVSLSALADGPWCGPAGLPHDGDLQRVRSVDVVLRAQASIAQFRGRDPRLFLKPGSARARAQVPDLTIGFRVSPPNLRVP